MTAVRDFRATAVAVAPFVALMWLVAAGVAATADDYEQASWWLLLVNQLVLVPALVGAAWWLGRRLAGPIGAVVAPLAVILVPVLGVLYANEAFRETYVDRVLTLAVGVADGWSLAAGALLLVAVALIVQGNRRFVAAGAALGVAVLAVAALSQGVGLEISWDAFEANMAGLREFTWSNRLLQWLPLAGAIGVARRSPLAALLLGDLVRRVRARLGRLAQRRRRRWLHARRSRPRTARLLLARRLRATPRSDGPNARGRVLGQVGDVQRFRTLDLFLWSRLAIWLAALSAPLLIDGVADEVSRRPDVVERTMSSAP